MTALLASLVVYPARWLCVLLAVLLAICLFGIQGFKREAAQAKAELAAYQAEVATTAAQAERDKADREARIRELLDASNKAREEGIAHAVESQQLLVADLRAGNVRLREQWAGCRSQVPGDASAGPGPDAGADDWAASASRVVRAADDADVWIRGLQDYARACQRLSGDEE